MIWDTLERVNKLRKEAMEDPEFLDSAKMHEEWLLSETHNQSNKGAKRRNRKSYLIFMKIRIFLSTQQERNINNDELQYG